MNDATGKSFSNLVDLLAQLRGPQGCPWDQEQTHDSLKRNLLEETYEVLETIDENDAAKLPEELGDVLLQVLFHAQIASEASQFTIGNVMESLRNKLVRRHPHVFGGAQASTPWDVETQWEEIKYQERSQNQEEAPLMDSVPRGMPALAYSQTIQQRAARVGFDWDHVTEVLEKMEEECQELEHAEALEDQESELGDLFFTVVNLSRWLNIDAESTLRKAATRFALRFTAMEAHCQREGIALSDLSIEEKDSLWQEAKRQQRSSQW